MTDFTKYLLLGGWLRVQMLDLVMAVAFLGAFGFILDSALAIRNAFAIRQLRHEVRASVAQAEERGRAMLAAVGGVEEGGAWRVPNLAEGVQALLEGVGARRDESGKLVLPESAEARAARFANGQVGPSEAREAREDKADARAIAAERIRAGLIGTLGDDVGQMAFDFAQKNKDSWRRALNAAASGKVEIVKGILAPTVDRYQVKVAQPGQRASSGSGELPF